MREYSMLGALMRILFFKKLGKHKDVNITYNGIIHTTLPQINYNTHQFTTI